MPGQKRPPSTRARIQYRAVLLRDEGLKQAEIVERLKKEGYSVSQQTVSRYLRAATKSYLAQSRNEMARQIKREVAAADLVEEEALNAWLDALERGDEKMDSSLLKRVIEASQHRAKLLQLIQDRVDVTSQGERITADRMAEADRAAMDKLQGWAAQFEDDSDGSGDDDDQ